MLSQLQKGCYFLLGIAFFAATIVTVGLFVPNFDALPIFSIFNSSKQLPDSIAGLESVSKAVDSPDQVTNFTDKQCHDGVDLFSRKVSWSWSSQIASGLYDAFARNGILYLIYLAKDFRRQEHIISHNLTNWVCTFDEGIAENGTSVVDTIVGESFRMVLCSIPNQLWVRWLNQDPNAEKYQQVTVTAEGDSGKLQIDKNLDVCRYPDVMGRLSLLSFHQREYPIQLAGCTIINHHYGRLLGWLSYHKLQGFEHFYIFANEDAAHILISLLQHYINEGFVDIIEYDASTSRQLSFWTHQEPQLNACLCRYRSLAKWVAIFDVDEYLIPLAGAPTIRTSVDGLDSALGCLSVPTFLFHEPAYPSVVYPSHKILSSGIELSRTHATCTTNPDYARLALVRWEREDDREIFENGAFDVVLLASGNRSTAKRLEWTQLGAELFNESAVHPSHSGVDIEKPSSPEQHSALPTRIHAHSTSTERRCVKGVDLWSRREFWKFSDHVFPGLYDAFASNQTLCLVFLARDWSWKQDFTPNNTDWVCHFGDDPSQTSVGTSIVHDHFTLETQIVLCPIPDQWWRRWILEDPDAEQVQRVTATARSASGTPFKYENVEVCRYPEGKDWLAGRAATRAPPQEVSRDGRSYPIQLAGCTMLRWNYDRVIEWLAHHKLQGFQHFYIYANENSKALRGLLKPYVDEGYVDIIEYEWNTSWVVSGWAHQEPQLNACLRRYRGLAKWVGLFDVDEFFVPAAGAPMTIRGYVDTQDDTVGCLNVPTYLFCQPPVPYGPYLTQKVWYRNAEPTRARPKCITRPETVELVVVHYVRNGNRMVYMNGSSELRIHHYKKGCKLEPRSTLDALMAAYNASLRAEIRRVYPNRTDFA